MGDTPRTSYVFVQRTFLASVHKRDQAVKDAFERALIALPARDRPLSTRTDVFHDDRGAHRVSLPVLCAEFSTAKAAATFHALLEAELTLHVAARVLDAIPAMGTTHSLNARHPA